MPLNFLRTAETELLKVVLAEVPVDAEAQKEWAATLLAVLMPREREVIELRFGFRGESRRLDEVAQAYGITRERIRQIEARALNKMRTSAARQPDVVAKKQEDILALPLSRFNLPFSVRAKRCFAKAGIDTLGDLIQKTSDDLLAMRSFNMITLVHVKELLKTIGFRLRFDD